MGLPIDMDATAIIAAGCIATSGRSGREGAWPRSTPRRRQRSAGIVDVASILGLPPGAIPASVQDSIAALVDEVECLRDEADQSRHVETFLAMEADRHSFLPVLTRRALLRELGRLLDLSEREALPGSLIYLHLGGIERLRVVEGLAASDAVLVQVAEEIRSELRQTDLLGYLDGCDFAVALAVAEDGGAAEKAENIAAKLAGRSFDWQGRPIILSVGLGVAHFRSGVRAEQLLAAADAARRGLRR